MLAKNRELELHLKTLGMQQTSLRLKLDNIEAANLQLDAKSHHHVHTIGRHICLQKHDASN